MELFGKLLEAFYIIITIIIVVGLSTALHELGHLVMGKLIGYKFVSYRIGPLMLENKSGRLCLRTHGGIAGTGGQCIMLPPESKEPEKVPAIPYHLGGGLFNLLTMFLALPLAACATSKFVRVFFVLLATISAGQAILNLVPLKVTVPNDGYNAMRILKSKADRIAIYKLLRISGSRDSSPEDFVAAFFAPGDEDSEYGRVLKLFRGSFFLDIGKLEEAQRIFAESASKEYNTIPYYRLEASCELMFCLILRGANREEIEQVYDQELREYIEKSKKNNIGKHRLLYAYQKCVVRDERAAQAELEEVERLLRSCTGKGEAKLETKLLERVKKLDITPLLSD